MARKPAVIGDERPHPCPSVSVAAGKLFGGGSLTIEGARARRLMTEFHSWNGMPKAHRAMRGGDTGMVETKTVLLVEDDASVLRLTSRFLRADGYALLQAANGKEAIRIARDFQEEIHLVVTDVIMPELSGKELFIEIETVRPGIKVLYITGYPENILIHNGSLTLKDPLLPKPFSADTLRRKVREILEIPEVRKSG
jgi:CheY-like chemotaxis protein